MDPRCSESARRPPRARLAALVAALAVLAPLALALGPAPVALAAVDQPGISIGDLVVGESDGVVELPVRLTDAGTSTVTVAFATQSGSASTVDHTATSGTLTFTPGQTAKVIPITINDDSGDEGIESFTVNLTNPVNSSLDKALGRILIVDDETVVASPRVSARDVIVDESAGVATVAVVLGGPEGQASASTTSVAYATSGIEATAGADFTAQSGTLTFAPGDTVKRVAIPIADDATAEGAERLQVTLTSPSGLSLGDEVATVTIGASDGALAGQPGISVGDVVVGESDGWVEVPITLSAPSASRITVAAATVSGSASSVDIAAVSTPVTFTPGQTTRTLLIEIRDDNGDEELESLTVTLSAPVNARVDKTPGRLAIVDDDTVVDTPRLFVRDVTIDESAGFARVVVLLGGPEGQASNSVVTVRWGTGVGTASSGSDYVASTGDLRFSPGQTVKTVLVPILDDSAAEPTERFRVSLTNVSQAVIVDGNAAVTIGDSDASSVAAPGVSVADAIVGESDGLLELPVTLTAPSASLVTVAAATVSGSASTVDHAALTTTVTFTPGQTTKVLLIELRDDSGDERLESFTVSLTNPVGAVVDRGIGRVSIIDDDAVVATPSIVARDVTVDETDGVAVVPILLGGPDGRASNSTLTVAYTTTAGTAAAGSDYTTISSILSFGPGQTVKSLVIPIADDALAEGAETFTLVLSSPTQATLGDVTATVTIGASDAAPASSPTVTIDDVVVGEPDGWARVPVTLSAPSLARTTVAFASASGTASTVDHRSFAGTLTFTPGQTTKTLHYEITDDSGVEGLEWFTVTLTVPVGLTLGDASARVSIIDDETGNTVPGAPSTPSVTAGNQQVTVSWSEPNNSGNAPITGYVITPFINGVAQTPRLAAFPATSLVVTGLTNGTAHTFRVAATNAFGTGPQSNASASVTPQPSVPDAPTGVTAVAGDHQATVSWTAPASNGGSPITQYVVTRYIGASSQGSVTVGAVTSTVVTGLTNGQTYTFRVAARNARGTGAQSAASAPVTPRAPYAPFPSWSAFITRQFRDVVGRAPTSTELATWQSALSGGIPRGALVDSLRRSNENTTNVDPTVRLYRAFLGRAPDQPGLVYWVGERRRGLALATMSNRFAGSREFINRYGALSNEAFVRLIYTDVLGRPADEAGVAFWTGELNAGRYNRGRVMIGFSESREYKTQQAQNTDVAVAHIFLLRRAATTAETTTWVTRQKAGVSHTTLLTELLDSPAYAAVV